MYKSKDVKGSCTYWCGKRSEVTSWLHDFAQQNKSTPLFFMTFSCAEYHWQNVRRLIKDRYNVVNMPDPMLQHNGPTVPVNKNTLVDRNERLVLKRMLV